MSEQSEKRDGQVLAVLKKSSKPLSPSEIGSVIRESWCMWDDGYGKSAPVSAVLKRIGAVSIRRGEWVKPSKITI